MFNTLAYMSQNADSANGENPNSPRKSKRLVGPFIVALVIGVAIGLGIEWPLSSSASSSAGDPDHDVDVVCGYAEHMPDPLQLNDVGPNDPMFWRLQGLGALGIAAGHGDYGHSELVEPAKELKRASNRWGIDRIHESLGDIRSACQDL